MHAEISCIIQSSQSLRIQPASMDP